MESPAEYIKFCVCLASAATKAWLRLTAGCAFLKICDVPYIYAKQVQKTYFFKMAVLMKVSG